MTTPVDALSRLAPAIRRAWEREPEPPRLVSIFGCAGERGPSVHYIFDRAQGGYEEIAVTDVAELGSLTPLTPAAAWHEREVHDRFGTAFPGHPDPRPLLRHERPRAAAAATAAGGAATRGAPEPSPSFTPVQGEGVTEVAVGPVHAGIIEPGHFHFTTMGDHVIFLELRHFYTHKGTEDLLAGVDALGATPIVESVSGDNCLAHAAAYCEAVERIAAHEPPPRALALRLVGLELERMVAHIGDFGAICGDVGFGLMPALAGRIKEDLLRASARFCGTRYWRGIAAPGGVSVDPAESARAELGRAVAAAGREFAGAAALALRTPSVEARLEGAGVLPPRVARDWALVGPVARASGAGLDARRARPYGAYRAAGFEAATLSGGDVMARARLRVLETAVSAELIRATLAAWPAGGVRAALPGELTGTGLAAVESPRGELLYWVRLSRGRIQRCHIRTPSFQNWPALPSAVIGGVIADFPLINKSFNLSYSGCDR